MKTKLLLVLALVFSASLIAAAPLGTAFTYQGRLNDGGVSAQGIYDLQFTIYDTGEGGGIVAGPITNSPVGVSNGLFTVTLDFGGDVFIGQARWLEIGVRTNGSVVDFATLAPRQAMTATPYARYAVTAGSAGSAGTATYAATVAAGAVDGAALQAGAVDSTKIADGAIAAGDLSPTLQSNTFWRLDGNAGTTPGTNFLGTTDNQPLQLRVNGAGALRLEPTTNAPNVIGGSSGNTMAPGVVGAAIAGGGNPATPSSNRISGSWSFIGGGTANEVGSPRSVVAGGVGNVIEGGSTGVAIGGGSQNLVQSNSLNAHIGGGSHNTIQSNASVATIGGGGYNIVRSNALAATIPGGFENEVAGSYGFAAGRRARANHPGAFVWSDSTLTPTGFASTGTNQFLINAGGGVGIGTNNPQSALHVAGTVKAADFAGSGAGLTVLNGGALVDDSITSAKIANGTIDTVDVASIEGDKIVGGDLTTARLKVGTNHSLSGTFATIAGGQNNTNLGNASALGGGYNNTIQTNANNSTIGGGGNNTIQTNAGNATIGGGLWNTIQRGTYAATIGGGYGNTIASNTQFASIPGGYNNAAASYAFAAGNRAKANHTGAFVWADSTGADFASGADNQFLIRAGGGVGIGTNNPQSALHVVGTVTADGFSGSGAGLSGISLSALPSGLVTNNQAGVTLHGTFNAATGLVIENRTSDPPSPAVGQIWLRTDL